MSETGSRPDTAHAVKGFFRNNWIVLTGITAAISTVGFPMVVVIRNNEAEYQATGEVGALLGHPLDRLAHAMGLSKIEIASLETSNSDYRKLVRTFPDLRFDPGDTPELRAMKIEAINAHWKTLAQVQINTGNENEAQIRKQLFAITNDPRTLKDDPRTPGIGYRPTADDIKHVYPGDFDNLTPADWDRVLSKPGMPVVQQLAAADALSMFIKTKITAEEQARAETDISGPATARARIAAVNRDTHIYIHLNRMIRTSKPLTFYAAARDPNPPPYLPTYNDSHQTTYLPDGSVADTIFRAAPEIIPAHKTIGPMFKEDGSLAIYQSYAIIWDGTEWGFTPLHEYQSAGLPQKEN